MTTKDMDVHAMNATLDAPAVPRTLPVAAIRPSRFSIGLYGDPDLEVAADGLLDSIRQRGILVPLVAAPDGDGFELLSGHRRLACARALDLDTVPCEVRDVPRGPPAGAPSSTTTASAARRSAS